MGTDPKSHGAATPPTQIVVLRYLANLARLVSANCSTVRGLLPVRSSTTLLVPAKIPCVPVVAVGSDMVLPVSASTLALLRSCSLVADMSIVCAAQYCGAGE